MKSGELAAWLGIAPVTVRLWTKEYGQFLSPSAIGGGKTRVFNEQDSRIMAYIAAMKAEGQGRENITATLSSLQADNWRNLPEMPPAPPGVEPISVIPREAAESRIELTRQRLMREVAMLQDTIETLENQLADERQDKARLQSELTEARELLGELRGRLGERDKTMQLVIAVAIGALVLVLIVVVLLAGR